jgi:hypothetical protein
MKFLKQYLAYRKLAKLRARYLKANAGYEQRRRAGKLGWARRRSV